jgi:photosystem II CP47 chlorophyll apoprotein
MQFVQVNLALNNSIFLNKAWEQVPEKLVLYDYIGCNPSKGGLSHLLVQYYLVMA